MQQLRRGIAEALDEERHQLSGVAERETERFGASVEVPHTEIDEAALEVPGSAEDPPLVIAEQDAAGRKFVNVGDAHDVIVHPLPTLSR